MKIRNILIGTVVGGAAATATVYKISSSLLKKCITLPAPKAQRGSHLIPVTKPDPIKEKIAEGEQWLKAQALETVYTKSFDGLTLAAELLNVENPKGTVISAHSAGSNLYHDCGAIAKHFSEKGYRVLLVHQRAHGKSEGKCFSYGINEAKDIVEWSGLVERRFGKGENIFLHGVSMGATSVLMASGYTELSGSVRGIIADSGYTSPLEFLGIVLPKYLHIPNMPFLYTMDAIAKEKVEFGLDDYDTRDALGYNNTRPILFFHGIDDEIVPLEMAEENYNACRTEKRLVVVDDAGHGLSYFADPELCDDAIDDFLDKYTVK